MKITKHIDRMGEDRTEKESKGLHIVGSDRIVLYCTVCYRIGWERSGLDKKDLCIKSYTTNQLK